MPATAVVLISLSAAISLLISLGFLRPFWAVNDYESYRKIVWRLYIVQTVFPLYIIEMGIALALPGIWGPAFGISANIVYSVTLAVFMYFKAK